MRLTISRYWILVLFLLFLLTSSSIGGLRAQETYPRLTGFAGIVHPLVTFGNGDPQFNFDGSYTVGLATGFSMWKNARIGFSIEFIPYVRFSGGTSRMSSFLFHPGALFALGHGYTLATRLAFETSGRYGLTPVLNKVLKQYKNYRYYVSFSVPGRVGNDLPGTVGFALQFGVGF